MIINVVVVGEDELVETNIELCEVSDYIALLKTIPYHDCDTDKYWEFDSIEMTSAESIWVAMKERGE